MTRTAELILEQIGPYGLGEDKRREMGNRDGESALTLFGKDLYGNERFQSWCLAGFQAAVEHGEVMALVAVASNFIRLGYEVAMAELSERGVE